MIWLEQHRNSSAGFQCLQQCLCRRLAVAQHNSQQLFNLSFILSLMVKWQGVPRLFQVSLEGLVQHSSNLSALVNSSGAFPGPEV